MLPKTTVMMLALSLCSFCFAVDGLPDPNDWFIQLLSDSDHIYSQDIQVSDTYVVLKGDTYYDGTGVYDLQYFGNPCREASVSGNSIASRTTGGIAIHLLGDRELIPLTDAYFGRPDIFTNMPTKRVVWEAGPDSDNTNVYFREGNSIPICLTDNAQCFFNGKSPKVSADTVAWISYDGNDDEIFMMRDGVITQLTFNDVDDGSYFSETLFWMADDGKMAWVAEGTTEPLTTHFYDGQYVHQLGVDYPVHDFCGVSEMGALYITGPHPDYPDDRSTLILHNGTEEVLIFSSQLDAPFGTSTAAIGGGSITWVGRPTYDDDVSQYFLKGAELISWPLPSYMETESAVGVWGNRLVWKPDMNALYFGEHLRRNCVNPPQMDTNDDCRVNLVDFAVFASEWLTCGYRDQSDCQ